MNERCRVGPKVTARVANPKEEIPVATDGTRIFMESREVSQRVNEPVGQTPEHRIGNAFGDFRSERRVEGVRPAACRFNQSPIRDISVIRGSPEIYQTKHALGAPVQSFRFKVQRPRELQNEAIGANIGAQSTEVSHPRRLVTKLPNEPTLL